MKTLAILLISLSATFPMLARAERIDCRGYNLSIYQEQGRWYFAISSGMAEPGIYGPFSSREQATTEAKKECQNIEVDHAW